MESGSCTNHYKDLSFFSGPNYMTNYLSIFILACATFEVKAEEITPLGLNAPHFSAPILKISGSQRDNLKPAYLFDYIIESSAANSNQETFASPQTLTVFSCSHRAQCQCSLLLRCMFYSTSSATDKTVSSMTVTVTVAKSIHILYISKA